jgi:hypothetical protein
MSIDIPKALFSAGHSAFALIDPSTERYRRVLDRHGAFKSGLKMHVAISYVWSEWKDNPSDRLPNWADLRDRLLAIVGHQTPPTLRKETWNATCCWLDSKCINQDSETDKGYWVPKMDEVYHEAECTVLLVRGCDLTVLMEIGKEMRCKFEGKVPLAERILAGPHSCLLTRSCTTLPDLSQQREDTCLRALKSFASGAWRRRAWIFQEILLSRKYLVSWSLSGWTSLAKIGVIAGLLFQKNSKEIWLEEFATWCLRVEYLRQYYETTSFSDLSDANILQMASGLEATVACDKYYALCGMLRLKRVQYDSTHTADRALHTIVEALTKAGRMSWLYAVPPSVEAAGIELSSDTMTPFVLTRMDGGKLIAKTRSISIDTRTLGLDATQVGIVTDVLPLHKVLLDSKALLEQTKFHLDDMLKHSSQPEVEILKHIPALINRAAVEIIAPLLLEPVFSDTCKTLSINVAEQNLRQWVMILILCFLDLDEYFQQPSADIDLTSISVVKSSAFSLRRHLGEIDGCFTLVKWDSVNNRNQGTITQRFALGFTGVKKGSGVYVLDADRNLLLTADVNQGCQDLGGAAFRGMLFQLGVREMIGLVPSSLFGPFWKSLEKGENVHLDFLLQGFD